jgi:hypothetical protein
MDEPSVTSQLAAKLADDIDLYTGQPGRLLATAFHEHTPGVHNCGFMLLSISCSLIELLGELTEGKIADLGFLAYCKSNLPDLPSKDFKGESKTLFTIGFRNAGFGHDDNVAETFYGIVRCGLMHSLFPKAGVQMSREFPIAFRISRDVPAHFQIHPGQFFEQSLNAVVALLRQVASSSAERIQIDNVGRRLSLISMQASWASTSIPTPDIARSTASHDVCSRGQARILTTSQSDNTTASGEGMAPIFWLHQSVNNPFMDVPCDAPKADDC